MLFNEENRKIFAEVVEQAKGIGIQEKNKKDMGDYINFYCSPCKRVAFQVHRHKDTGNVALAIPDIDGKCPKMKDPIAGVLLLLISGYYRNNKKWLDGYKGIRYPFKPVKVFRLCESIANNFNSRAWEEVKGLLSYALDQCHKKT
jgi:hypothetical protein